MQKTERKLAYCLKHCSGLVVIEMPARRFTAPKTNWRFKKQLASRFWQAHNWFRAGNLIC